MKPKEVDIKPPPTIMEGLQLQNPNNHLPICPEFLSCTTFFFFERDDTFKAILVGK